MKLILGALAAATLLTGIAAAQPAEARCFWNGYVTECFRTHHHSWWWRHHRPYYGYNYYRDWGWYR